MSMHAAILAGGRGERFWPLSRARRPKQVLSLVGSRSLLAETVERTRDRIDPDHVWIISADEQRTALTSLSLPVKANRYLWEPLARNTAPAIGAAATLVGLCDGHDPDPSILILPSDHWIPDLPAFWRSIAVGAEIVRDQDQIVTFGIPVTRPETGYGYIERGAVVGPAAFAVARFHEKPDLASAQGYQESGRFYWNAGIFLVRARTILAELREHVPKMGVALDGLQMMLKEASTSPASDAAGSSPGQILGSAVGWRAYFEACPSISIDVGVLERSARVAVVEAEFAWSDLGGWEAWGDLQAPDESGNRVAGATLVEDAHDNVVFAGSDRMVALLGVSNLVVVQTDDVTLVCPRDRAQEIREIVRRGRADPLLKEYF